MTARPPTHRCPKLGLNKRVSLGSGSRTNASIGSIRVPWKQFVEGGYSSQTDFDAFVATATSGLQTLVDANPGKRIAVFCHGGVINAWATHVLGIAPRLFLDAHYASVNRFMAASSGERSITSLNEVAHLRPMASRAER